MNSDIMIQNSAIPSINVKLSIFILVFFLLLVFLRNFLPQFRHLVYLIFPVTFFLVFIGNEGIVRLENRRKNLLFLGITWVVIIIFSLLFNIAAISFSRYLKEFYFLTASIFSAVFFYSFANIKNVETGFKIILILSVILIPIAYHQQIIELLDFDVIEFLIHSTSETETILSYFLGLMALYFFLKGQLLYFLVSLVLVLIGSKRGVYLGLVFCIMAYYVFKPLSGVFKKNPSSTAIFFTLCNLIIAY